MVEIFGFSRPSMVRNAALREVFVQICVRKTVGLFELAGLPCKVLTEAWLLQGPPKAATEAAPTGQAGCVEPFRAGRLVVWSLSWRCTCYVISQTQSSSAGRTLELNRTDNSIAAATFTCLSASKPHSPNQYAAHSFLPVSVTFIGLILP